MHLGRLPAKTAAEADAMVAKIIGYEALPTPTDFSDRVLFVTDNPDKRGQLPRTVGRPRSTTTSPGATTPDKCT